MQTAKNLYHRQLTNDPPTRLDKSEIPVELKQPPSIQHTNTEQVQPTNVNNESSTLTSPPDAPIITPTEATTIPTSKPKISVGREFQNIQEGKTELTRSQRTRTPNPKYVNITIIADHCEPQSFAEAMKSPIKNEWIN